MPSIHASASEKLRVLEEKQLLRELKTTLRHDGVSVERNGKALLSFACNDYLGLSHDMEVKQAAINAIETYGTGAGASRLVSGNHPLYIALENAFSDWKKVPATVVFGSGYLANMGLISALAGEGDLILADKFAHACMLDGTKLSGATLHRFVHNDMESLKRQLQTHRGKHEQCLILTEAVFSMDGDVAPLEILYSLAQEYDALLVVDDAHALGVTGGGAGTRYLGENMLIMGTLSKAAGAYGGYVCGSKPLINLLVNQARSLIFSTGLPPSVIASAHAAIQIMRQKPERIEALWNNIRAFADRMGLRPQSAIVPLIIGEPEKALRISAMLEEAGYYVSAIRPPTVPQGTSRLRFTFSALHTATQIQALCEDFFAIMPHIELGRAS
jgi:8-amino-7-oxononanoate synthase